MAFMGSRHLWVRFSVLEVGNRRPFFRIGDGVPSQFGGLFDTCWYVCITACRIFGLSTAWIFVPRRNGDIVTPWGAQRTITGRSRVGEMLCWTNEWITYIKGIRIGCHNVQ